VRPDVPPGLKSPGLQSLELGERGRLVGTPCAKLVYDRASGIAEARATVYGPGVLERVGPLRFERAVLASSAIVEDRMLTQNHIKEGLSRAFILAVAHRAGLNCAFQAFDYGLDGTFRDVKMVGNRRVESGFSIDFQAKASENCTFGDDFVTYDLEAKSHKDLVDATVGAPRILIVLALPEDESRWLEVSAESLVLRRSAFWMSLRGQTPTTNKTRQVVKIPRAQVFDVQAVNTLFGRVRAGEPL
jgi:hypothetical protein